MEQLPGLSWAAFVHCLPGDLQSHARPERDSLLSDLQLFA